MKRTGRTTMAVLAALITTLALSPGTARAEPDFTNRKLWNALSGWCLSSVAPNVNQPVNMQPGCNGSQQLWQFWPVESTAANDYTVRPFSNTNLCLDQHFSGSTPTTLLRAWSCSGVSNQRWIVSFKGPGNVWVNARSGWCLDQSHTNNNTTPTATVVAWSSCHHQLNQHWYNN